MTVARGKTSPAVAPVATLRLPVLLLDQHVLFPRGSLPIKSWSGLSLRRLQKLHEQNLSVAVVTTADLEATAHSKLPTVATLGHIAGFERLGGGEKSVILKGSERLTIVRYVTTRKGLEAEAAIVAEPSRLTDLQLVAAKRLQGAIQKLLKAEFELAEEQKTVLLQSDHLRSLPDLIAPHLSVPLAQKLEILQAKDFSRRCRLTYDMTIRELGLQRLSHDIHEQVQTDISEEERVSYLRDQLATIKRELGEVDQIGQAHEILEAAIQDLSLPPVAAETAKEELSRLSMASPGTPEFVISHSYLSLLKELPWKSEPPVSPSIAQARKVLNRVHYGLDDVKQRILEYLAVLHRRGEIPGQILLLHGPPGVGKTSLARSIAEALGRPFERISLGGVKDEAEMRGHRRTYIGALPGKIIQAIKQSRTQYPVILLDEVDKVGHEREAGGIAAALLEILDREQNQSFIDHYVSVPFDISKVVFIATANDKDAILPALADRMDAVEVSSYTDQEKIQIAKKHIVPHLLKELRLTKDDWTLNDQVLHAVLRQYTREAGVRQLKRELTRLGRKLVLYLTEHPRRKAPAITVESLPQWLGVRKFMEEPNDGTLMPGVSIGLAYTEFGGEILYIESRLHPVGAGKGLLRLTGNVGKVMQESAQAVVSYLGQYTHELGLREELFMESDIHIHLPDGATPKDGPSAGIAILCALVSAATRKPLRADLAMTGEITLRGQVLPIGGLKEKVLAAHRYGKKMVLFPEGNIADLRDIPPMVRRAVKLIPVATMREVLEHAALWPGVTYVRKPGKPIVPSSLEQYWN